MKKTLTYLAGTVIVLLFIIGITIIFFPDIQRSTHFDVMMINGQLYFVLEKESKLREVEVYISTTATFEKLPVTMWRIVNPIQLYAEDTLKIRQIKYGEISGKFDERKGPGKLGKNVKYTVAIKSSQGPGAGTKDFVITDNNEVVIIR